MFVRNGVPESRIDVVPYGVDSAGLKPGADAPASIAAPLTLGFMGSLAPHKGVHLLIEAVRKVSGDIRLSIHGRTSDFPDYSKQLRDLAAGDERVEFHGPYLREALGTILSAMDVLVLPSLWYENTPFVALEAFAAGIPVVATDVGGLAEIVQDGVSGKLFRRGDVADLARCLQDLVDKPELLSRYRDGIPEVETLDTNVRGLEAMYRGGAVS
jgi:glycosyltransferase involved in cell wall biosynthesis